MWGNNTAVPLLWLSLAFLCGVLLGWLAGWPPVAWLVLAGLVLFLVIIYKLVRRLPAIQRFAPAGDPAADPAAGPATRPWWAFGLPYPLLLVALCLGAARYRATQVPITPEQLAWYNDQETRQVVEGLVQAPPERGDQYTLLTVEAEQVRPVEAQAFTAVGGRLLARAPAGRRLAVRRPGPVGGLAEHALPERGVLVSRLPGAPGDLLYLQLRL